MEGAGGGAELVQQRGGSMLHRQPEREGGAELLILDANVSR